MKYIKKWHVTAALRGILFGIGAKSIVWGIVFILASTLHDIAFNNRESK